MEQQVPLTFASLGLSEQTVKLLEKKGFKNPTPIQSKTIPFLLGKNDHDLVAQAQTGTGKTAAFGLPLIELLKKDKAGVQALVMTPTRELAIQVAEEIQSFVHDNALRILAVYGGQSIDTQLRSLTRGVDIVVGTPGRIKDHIKRRSLNLKSISHVVLDEADEMLNMGFIDDVQEILQHVNTEKRMLLFSATMPPKILELARNYMKNYEVLSAKSEQVTTNLTQQLYCEVSSRDKIEALCRIMDIEASFYGLVFCRTKRDVDAVVAKLLERGYAVEALHGDISQVQRERILKALKNKKVSAVIATDVAARGIDVANLTHVVNYALPEAAEAYVHRIGRTGRAGNEGKAISLISGQEFRKLSFIKRIAKADIKKMELPTVQEIVESKKARIIQKIVDTVTSPLEVYEPIAQKLIAAHDARQVVAALLKCAFSKELDASSYAGIAAAHAPAGARSFEGGRNGGPSRGVQAEQDGTQRLFVAKGKNDGMHIKKLIEFIAQKSDVQQQNIQQVKVLDSFSFITVPYDDADMILQSFRGKGGQKPLVTRAKQL